MSDTEKDLYFVAVKVFLEKDGKFLIVKDSFGNWDLPGGRIRKGEFETPLEAVIRRKIFEELGPEIVYTSGRPAVFMRHERVEGGTSNTVRIFAIGYEATLESGEVRLSHRHTEMLWADQRNFKPEKYFTGGWLKGVEEYIKIRQT